ncbi:transposase [Streptomyces axinellae]|uniref:Tc1-like transposase DDE domain-containing protein n=1 Tax=Streptomyces axinellae TaxID=552788 RepID=A0ABN3PR60_9ACTN
MRARVAEQDWLTLERLPAYAPELNPVELLWSSLKKRELANLAGDHLADVADATEQGIHRINTNPRLPTPDSRLPTPDSRLPTPDSRLPTAMVIPHPYRPDHPPTTPTELTKRSVRRRSTW